MIARRPSYRPPALPRESRPCRGGLFTLVALIFAATPAVAREDPAPSWAVVERSILQDRGHWQVDYRLRLDGPSAWSARPDEFSAHVESWVSNSRVPAHQAPRRSSVDLSGGASTMAMAEVIPSGDEARRCREKARLVVWPADQAEPVPPEPDHIRARRDKDKEKDKETPAPPAPWRLEPGGELRVRLRLEHEHFLHGPYDPLLGVRDLTIRLGAIAFRDTIPLDQERYHVLPVIAFATPPADRLDNRYYISEPDSLHLDAQVPGNASYRLAEQSIRYATLMRLSYWYLIAYGTEGECRVRYHQSRDAPGFNRTLTEGSRDDIMPVVGRWTRVEFVFRTEPEATNLTIDFRIAGAEIGEMWIDDIQLESIPPPSRP